MDKGTIPELRSCQIYGSRGNRRLPIAGTPWHESPQHRAPYQVDASANRASRQVAGGKNAFSPSNIPPADPSWNQGTPAAPARDIFCAGQSLAKRLACKADHASECRQIIGAVGLVLPRRRQRVSDPNDFVDPHNQIEERNAIPTNDRFGRFCIHSVGEWSLGCHNERSPFTGRPLA